MIISLPLFCPLSFILPSVFALTHPCVLSFIFFLSLSKPASVLTLLSLLTSLHPPVLIYMLPNNPLFIHPFFFPYILKSFALCTYAITSIIYSCPLYLLCFCSLCPSFCSFPYIASVFYISFLLYLPLCFSLLSFILSTILTFVLSYILLILFYPSHQYS